LIGDQAFLVTKGAVDPYATATWSLLDNAGTQHDVGWLPSLAAPVCTCDGWRHADLKEPCIHVQALTAAGLLPAREPAPAPDEDWFDWLENHPPALVEKGAAHE
jgi:hypothetical protein